MTTTLTCGARLRPLHPNDRDALIAFHAACSDHTHYLRFFGAKPRLSETMATYFCDVDGDHRIAIVAVIDGPQADTIIGVGRLEPVNNTTGEIAFVVVDTWQGQGIGTALVSAIVEAARAVGYRNLVAETLGENSRMRRRLAATGLASTTHFDGSAYRTDMALDRAGTAAAA